MDEKVRWLTISTASLDDLPSRPLACRVERGSDMHDFPTGVMDDEKDIDRPEEDRLDAEEIASPDFTRVQREKIPPARRRSSSMNAPHVLRDGPGRDFESQSCQLRLDTFLSPQEVFSCHATNERLHFRRNCVSTRSSMRSRAPAPIGFLPPTVPTQHRRGCHDQKWPFPARAPSRRQDPKATIPVLSSRPGMPSLQYQ